MSEIAPVPGLEHPPVFHFGVDRTDGDGSRKALLGGKGANLAEMTRIGIPVPPGFTITTELCNLHGRDPEAALLVLRPAVDAALAELESAMHQSFGNPERPLLVSVRSGAPISMPGMMDTVLNVGLSAEVLEGIAPADGENESRRRFAVDCRLRLIEMFGTVVRSVPVGRFDALRQSAATSAGVPHLSDLTVASLDRLEGEFLAAYASEVGSPFPEDPREQLEAAILAVFASWEGARAVTYRRLRNIAPDLGTGVNVQAMVFGNSGPRSATGVCFTRNPANGEPELYGEYLANAQGEEVVAGVRTPLPIEPTPISNGMSFAETFPDGHRELLEVREQLENHYGDVQDIEFTVQEDRLFILQTRRGQRTGLAALRIAGDLVDEGRIDPEHAVERVDPSSLSQLLAPVLTEEGRAAAMDRCIARGLAAGPGGASGRIALDAQTAVSLARSTGEPVLLVRNETSPEDIAGMAVAAGILTSRGGATSHAAVVARGLGKPCVVGCEEIHVDETARTVRSGSTTVAEGETLSIDGSTGEVFVGSIPTRDSEILRVVDGELDAGESPTFQRFERLLGWADDRRTMQVRANADTPQDAARARALGAEGIGLCRTEHMFFAAERILAFRRMILARDAESRDAALSDLLPWQREDFVGILSAMDGLPVTIRLLDPPLHEFLPHEDDLEQFSRESGIAMESVRERIEETRESNPMLGTRGCRLGILRPEIIRMQCRAILEAAAKVRDEGGDPRPEIMIPLVAVTAEAERTRAEIECVAAAVFGDRDAVPFPIGTMIETPRAALVAGALAPHLDFFSFGTNDLTQMTFGLSRDDTAGLLRHYLDEGIIADDPFDTLDREGVGALIAHAVEHGRAARPDLKVGICGEHGGDPRSIAFCRELGLDSVSCSPLRVPGARLAAAQTGL